MGLTGGNCDTSIYTWLWFSLLLTAVGRQSGVRGLMLLELIGACGGDYYLFACLVSHSYTMERQIVTGDYYPTPDVQPLPV
jgi:hypothetical protein